MSAPVIGLFYIEDTADVAQRLVTALVEFLRAGHRVRVVDADLRQGYVSRMMRGKSWQGADFAALLSEPDQPVQGADLTADVAASQPERAWLELVPALPPDQDHRPEWLDEPPLQGARRYLSLKRSIGRSDRPLDLVILIAPAGNGALVRNLLAHAVDAAVFIAKGEATQVAALSLLSRDGEARRGAALPTLCVEGRDGREANLAAAWHSFWRSAPSYHPPGERPKDGPPRLLVLEGDYAEADWALAMRRLVGVHEPDPTERLREADSEGWTEVAEGAFAELYRQDRERALDLYESEIAPRLGTLFSAVAATRAVWQTAPERVDDVHRCAKYAVQKLRISAPSPLTNELVPLLELVVDQADAGRLGEEHARALLNLAEGLIHRANLLRASGEELGDELSRAEALIVRAHALPMRDNDLLISSLAWAHLGRLRGDMTRYDAMLDDLRRAQPTVPRAQVLQRVVEGMVHFARVDASLWKRVHPLAEEQIKLDPREGHWNMAILLSYLGRFTDALDHLWLLGRLDRDAYHQAFADPDLTVLWEGVGRPNFAKPASRKRPTR